MSFGKTNIGRLKLSAKYFFGIRIPSNYETLSARERNKNSPFNEDSGILVIISSSETELVNNINENTSDVGHDQNDNLSELPKGSDETTELPTLFESESSSVTTLGEEMSFDLSFDDNGTDNIVKNNVNVVVLSTHQNPWESCL